MFLLKKFTNFTLHKLLHKSQNILYIVTPSSVELYTLDIVHIKSYDIRDKILNTVFDNNLYVLTPSSLIEINENDFLKYNLENIYIKVQIYLNKIFLISKNLISIYNKKMNKEHDIIKVIDDMVVDSKYIYILENDLVFKYEYLNKILIKVICDKQVKDHSSKNEIRTMINNKKSLVMFNDFLYILDFVEYYYIYNNILYLKNEECLSKIENNKLEKDIRKINYVSEDLKYIIYDNQITNYKDEIINEDEEYFKNITNYKDEEYFKKISNYKDEKNLKNLTNYKDEKNLKNITNHNDEEYLKNITNYEDEKYFIQNIVKLPDLTNIKNIKLINISCVKKEYCNIKEENENIYKTDNFIIFCKEISKSIQVDTDLFLISPSYIYRYSIQDKVKYISKLQVENIHLITDRFIYYTNKSLYFIYDMKDNNKYKYIKKDIMDINKLNNKLIIYEHKFVRIYKINTQKYKRKLKTANDLRISYLLDDKIQASLCVDDKIRTSHYVDDNFKFLYCKELKNNLIYFGFDRLVKIYKLDKFYKEFPIEGLPLDIKVEKDYIYINIKYKGIHIYKDGILVRRDNISRNIQNFYIYDNKIYINDVSRYLIILDLSFNILGMVYLDEYIQRWYIKKERIYFLSTLENIYRIKKGIKRDDKEYFKSHPRINIIIE